MVSLQRQQEESIKRMKLFDSMPEELKELSRKHGGTVDQMYAKGISRDGIMYELKRLGKF